MLKKLKKSGSATLAKAEILNISSQGIWIMVSDHEYFIPYCDFTWFLKATIEQIYVLELFHERHLHWPALDIDIDIESLKHPELYPLRYS